MKIKPRVAIYYDWLNQWGGAEKVLLSLLKLYPHSPVYTLVHDPNQTRWLPPDTKIITSFINRLPFSDSNPIYYTPFYDLTLERFDLSQYDIVISTTSTIGHCLLTQPKTMFICYFHTINRYLYQTPAKYTVIKPLLNLYQKIDHYYSRRPDHILCNSQTVKERITKYYQLPSQVVYPGIDTSFFYPSNNKTTGGKYFLTVSRLVPHKNIDLVIKTFQHLKYNLKIVGIGRELTQLKRIAGDSPNITFLGAVSDHELLKLYQNCQALICPQLEDFGLTPIEAMACGTPVIAYHHGGNIETIVANKTGVFFDNLSPEDLADAIKQFFSISFDSDVCRQQSLQFSEKQFMLNFKKIIDSLWQNYQTTTS